MFFENQHIVKSDNYKFGVVRQTLTGLEETKVEAFFMQHITLSNQRVIHFLISYKLLCFVDVFDG